MIIRFLSNKNRKEFYVFETFRKNENACACFELGQENAIEAQKAHCRHHIRRLKTFLYL